MAKRFEFDPELNLYAYSVEGLIELCKNNKNLSTHAHTSPNTLKSTFSPRYWGSKIVFSLIS